MSGKAVSDATRVREQTAEGRRALHPELMEAFMESQENDRLPDEHTFGGNCTISCAEVDRIFGETGFFREEPTW